LYGRSFNVVLASWFYGHALGMAIILPAILLAARPHMVRDFGRSRAEQAGLYLLVAAVSATIFAPGRFPSSLLLLPVLTLVACRLGPRGAALGGLVTAVMAAVRVVEFPSAPARVDWSLGEKTRSLQFLIAVCFFTSLATSMAISDQQRLKRLWASR